MSIGTLTACRLQCSEEIPKIQTNQNSMLYFLIIKKKFRAKLTLKTEPAEEGTVDYMCFPDKYSSSQDHLHLWRILRQDSLVEICVCLVTQYFAFASQASSAADEQSAVGSAMLASPQVMQIRDGI
nr:hypothetical protein R11F4.4 - Caenorhabditis elegans [Caenorhabditis elegans]